MISKYIGGLVALIKDALRLAFYFLKRPLYVAVILILIIGIFYWNGVPPQKISVFLSGKWQAFVENRKQTFKEDMQLISDHFNRESARNPAKKQEKTTETAQSYRQQAEEEAQWKKAFEEARKKVEIPDENAVKGILSVIGADEVRIEDQTFFVNVRVRSGKATEAYQQMKRRFDGKEAKCVPDKDDPEKAECFVGALGISEMLIDFGLADPL